MKQMDLIVIGAGNPDIIKLIEEINDYKKTFNLIGFLEKNESLFGKKVNGYEIIGSDDLLKTKFRNCAVVNNVGADTILRYQITKKLTSVYKLKKFPNLIHPRVSLRYVKLGKGNIVYDNVSIGANVKLGNFNIVFYGSVIGHEAVINNFNLIGGNTMVGSRSKLTDRIFISSSCSIKSGLKICSDVFLGVSSVVINNIDSPAKFFGNPARRIPV